ncbi:MAG: oxamate carbamoyltransferase subunit AllH family protein [Solirubrobacteraceae bacterium]
MIAARPALERLGGRPVRVAGAGHEAAYVEDDGFVAVLTTGRPLLPNGIQVGRLPAVGDEVVVRGEPWDPTLSLPGDPAALGDEILVALGHDAATGRDEVAALARAVGTRDPAAAKAAGAYLVGRGPGLTPEGDDLVGGLAAVLSHDRSWVAALIGADLRVRTTALSATLLELAARGMGPEPLQALLAGEPGALDRLLRLGHSTGRAYALGAGLALRHV